MVALEAFITFYPQSKNRQMTSSKNQSIIQPNLQWVFAGIAMVTIYVSTKFRLDRTSNMAARWPS
jgi:hypothetical protein